MLFPGTTSGEEGVEITLGHDCAVAELRGLMVRLGDKVAVTREIKLIDFLGLASDRIGWCPAHTHSHALSVCQLLPMDPLNSPNLDENDSDQDGQDRRHLAWHNSKGALGKI